MFAPSGDPGNDKSRIAYVTLAAPGSSLLCPNEKSKTAALNPIRIPCHVVCGARGWSQIFDRVRFT
jgi:hypothetical protein